MDTVVIILIVLGSIIGCCGICYLLPFCFFKQHRSSCDEVSVLIPEIESNLSGKIIIVTGATSGIGLETIRALCQSNCTLILACRNTSKADKIINELKSLKSTKANLITEKLDLSNLNQIKDEFVNNLQNKHSIDKINILMCNAGLLSNEKGKKTFDGYELTFGTNHLGHMYLSLLLKPLLESGAIQKNDGNFLKSRIIVTSSSVYSYVSLNTLPFENYEKDENNTWDKVYNVKNENVYSGTTAYNASKLFNMWFVREFAKRYGNEDKIIAVSLHPGVGPTGMMPEKARGIILKLKIMDTIPQLAYTQTWLSVTKQDNLVNGEFYNVNDIVNVKPIGKNENYSKSLWILSQKLINDVTNQA